MTFGQKLHTLRKENGWSQEELASKITVSRQAISKWELDEVTPDTENIIQLSEVFNVSTDFLLRDSYSSDKDIPAVKKAEIKTQNETNLKWLLKVGSALLIIGVIIAGVLVTLSQIIPSRVMVEHYVPKGGILYLNPDGTTELSDEEYVHSSYMDIKSFIPFLNTYYLHWVLILACASIVGGTVAFLRYHKLKKKGQSLLYKF